MPFTSSPFPSRPEGIGPRDERSEWPAPKGTRWGKGTTWEFRLFRVTPFHPRFGSLFSPLVSMPFTPVHFRPPDRLRRVNGVNDMRRKRAEITWGEPNRRTAGLRGLTARPKKSSVTALGSHGRDNRQDMEMIMRSKNPQYFNDFQYFSIIFNIGVLWFLSYLFPLVPRSRSALFVHGTSPAGRVEWEESERTTRGTKWTPKNPNFSLIFFILGFCR